MNNCLIPINILNLDCLQKLWRKFTLQFVNYLKESYDMKKFLVLFAMVAFVGTMASAQSPAKCTKSKAACTKSKTASAKTVSAELPACSVKAAAQLASLDENIQAKTCAASGKVSYYKKNVCSASGKVSLKEVKYCGTSKAFVNVAPPSKEAKVLQASDTKKKASCAKKCTKSKSACSKTKAAATGTAKQVKLENN